MSLFTDKQWEKICKQIEYAFNMYIKPFKITNVRKDQLNIIEKLFGVETPSGEGNKLGEIQEIKTRLDEIIADYETVECPNTKNIETMKSVLKLVVYNLYRKDILTIVEFGDCTDKLELKESEKITKIPEFLLKQEVENALNKCFGHTLKYKGFIQIFPNAIYRINGKKVLELYNTLKLTNKVGVKKEQDCEHFYNHEETHCVRCNKTVEQIEREILTKVAKDFLKGQPEYKTCNCEQCKELREKEKEQSFPLPPPVRKRKAKIIIEKSTPGEVAKYNCPVCNVPVKTSTTTSTGDDPNEAYFSCPNCLRSYSESYLKQERKND